MLQPFQLQDVSVRYADEIAELRDFLAKSGFPVRTGQALGLVVARLRRDRTFHRDLTSYIWVVLDRYDRISYPAVLGVLALAAAGETFAETAHEEDAHYLLRFLMEARHSLDGETKQEAGDVIATPPMEPAQPAPQLPAAHAAQIAEPMPRVETDPFAADETEESERRGNALPWIVGAVCALAILLAVLWVRHRPAQSAGNATATPAQVAASNVPETAAPTETAPAAEPVTPAAPDSHIAEKQARARERALAERKNVHPSPFRAPERSSPAVAPAAPSIPSLAASRPPQATPNVPQTMATTTHASSPAQALPATAPTANTPDSATHVTTPAPIVRAAEPAKPATSNPTVASIGPSAAGARKLASVTLPTAPASPDSAQQGTGDTSKTGRPAYILHRRSPVKSADTYDDGTEIAAEGTPPLGARPSDSAGTAPAGIVRGATLGNMAANEVYSPLPAYPVAASASHVQGEVKLSASVDKDGRVASVRVISGPPLLRDAALSAVQRWRYRPYQTAGGPTPTAAIAVLEFQLP